METQNNLNIPSANAEKFVVQNYTIQPWDTLLKIVNSKLQNQHIANFIEWNRVEAPMRAGQKLSIADKGSHYIISIDGVSIKRPDGQPMRFFKSQELYAQAKVQDRERRREQQKSRAEQEFLLEIHKETGGKFDIRPSDYNSFTISHRWVESGMNFLDLPSAGRAGRIIEEVLRIYAQNFWNSREKPNFEVDDYGAIFIDTNRYGFVDTTYISVSALAHFSSPSQDRRNVGRDVAKYLNAIIKKEYK